MSLPHCPSSCATHWQVNHPLSSLWLHTILCPTELSFPPSEIHLGEHFLQATVSFKQPFKKDHFSNLSFSSLQHLPIPPNFSPKNIDISCIHRFFFLHFPFLLFRCTGCFYEEEGMVSLMILSEALLIRLCYYH